MESYDKSSDQDDSQSSKNCSENQGAFIIKNEKANFNNPSQLKLATINELPVTFKLDQSNNSDENKNCSLSTLKNNSDNLCEIENFRKDNSKVNLDKSFFCKQDTISTRQDNSFENVKSPSIFTRKKPREMAVELKNLSFSYGKGKKQVKILNDIKLRVPLGGIYGLLGPSGCGKTSLLKMVVGLKKPKQGIARVFGTVPGFKNAFIPGPGLGYMPQEIALFQDLTVAETLIFYSKIYRMKQHLVPERIEFLLKLLDLEQKGNRLIRQLSGGQKRRVSLAAAMVHSPPLVILDEPTVGVDPLLRQSIWNHLVRLVKEISLTVIITTHYIEEARQANTVGLMRFGRILVESNPEKLLKKYGQSNLEDVFLKLCLMDEKEFNHNDSDFDYEEEEDDEKFKQQIKFDKDSVRYSISAKEDASSVSYNDEQLPKVVISDFSVPISPHVVREKENFNQGSIFVDNSSDPNKTFEENFENDKEHKARVPLSPLNFETISKKRDQNLKIEGRDRSNSDVSLGSSIIEYDSNTSRETNATPIKLATLNQDFKCKFEPQTTYKNNVKTSVLKIGALFYKNITLLRRNLPLLLFQFLLPSLEIILFSLCIGADPFNIPIAVFNQDSSGNLSQRFLESIDGYTVNQINKPTLPLAIEAARNGEAWGAIAFKQNFSGALTDRLLQGLNADNHTIDQSNIYIFLDMTNQLIGYKLQRTFLESFRKFSKDLLIEIDANPDIADIPIKIGKPIYGDREPTFTEFMAPGVVLTIAFLATVALTALAFVVERKDSIMERILVAGVTPFEFLMSHIVTQVCVIVVQVALLLIFTFLVFDIPSRGPFIWVILLTLLQAICGMEYGLLISSLCENETAATMLALGSFYPNLLLSGTVWPTQAMPDFMRYFSYILPQTIPIESMRYILSRGWDPSHPEVALGFIITIAWTIIFMIATVFAFKKIH